VGVPPRLNHPAMQRLGCEPVRRPRSRWPSWPATRSTFGAWSRKRPARSLQRTSDSFTARTKGRKPRVCTWSSTGEPFPCSGRAPDALGKLPGPGNGSVALLLRSAREARLDLDPESIPFSGSRSGNLVLVNFATPSSSQLLPSRFGTGRLPAGRHALDTITRDGLYA
jgi:hypothetical protein